jgi:hypothetical protein
MNPPEIEVRRHHGCTQRQGKKHELLSHQGAGSWIIFIDQLLFLGHHPLRGQQGRCHKHVGKINLLGRTVAQKMSQQATGKWHGGNRHQEHQIQPYQSDLQMADKVHCQMMHYPEKPAIKK